MTDVGDAVRLEFTTATGALVTAEITDPDGVTSDPVTITETPAGSGRWPFTFTPGRPRSWAVTFRATGAATAVERYLVNVEDLGPYPLATVDDVTELFRPLAGTETALTTALLRYASKVLRTRVPRLDARIADGSLDSGLVTGVAVAMVLRVLRNPQGVRQQSIGPFAATYDADAAARFVYLDDTELALLAPAPPAAAAAPSRTVRVTPGMGLSSGGDAMGWGCTRSAR